MFPPPAIGSGFVRVTCAGGALTVGGSGVGAPVGVLVSEGLGVAVVESVGVGTGQVLKTDPTTYRPTAEVTRHVTARDPHCRFPGCMRASRRCDLDHVVPFNHAKPQAGGPTTPDNLIPLCRRHHLTKHRAGWHIGYNSSSGNVTWTAPTGHTYTDQPTPASC